MSQKNINRKASALALSLMMVLAIIALVPSVFAAYERNYTLNADFDEGILANVEHDVSDQLQLSKELVSLPLIWIPNSDEGTVSKVDTETGKEIGRYFTGPNTWGSPSRTTVDLMGNVWFGNRGTGTVVKIGLYEAGQCKDKNGNGIIETSKDLNNDGNVVGAEILPWGTDECVLYEITGIPGARGIAIDSDNNLWAGAYGANFYKHINGETGAEIGTITTSHSAYGAVIDSKGILWSSEWSDASVGKLDPSIPSYTSKSTPQNYRVYGMGIDANENLFVSGYDYSRVSKYDISSGSPVWVWTTSDADLYLARGVVVTSDGDVWVAASGTNKVIRLSNDGVIKARITVGAYPTGVSVDKDGKVWVVNYNDGYIKRIDPATDVVDLEKIILGNDGTGITHHYGYSDMTGYVARTITTKTGTWTVVSDSGSAGTPWGTISWNSAEPAGATVSVRTRSSEDNAIWSVWKDATNNVELAAVPDGRYLQTETTLQITSGDVSSVLFDLKVKAKPPANQPPIAVITGQDIVDEGNSTTLDCSASTDPDADPLVCEWDLDNNGIYETTGMTVAVNPPDGPATITVGLKVTDSKGASSTDTATVTVNNVAPAVSIDPVAPINEGSSFSDTGSFTDPGADTWTATVDYGTGPEPLTLTGKNFNLVHTYPDNGVYIVTVTVTDKDGGVGTDTVQVIVNDIPVDVGPITVSSDLVQIGTPITATSTITAAPTDTGAAIWNWDDGTQNIPIGSFPTTLSTPHTYTTPGVYTINLMANDDDGNTDSEKYEYVVVYDPNGGFVTGGGWINSPPGAYVADPALTGRANFGFVSKYQKGAKVPTGETEFQFQTGKLNFHSTVYEWLVVAGAKAQYKGSGTINGAGDYGFMLTAIDGAISGGGGVDKFRIKIVEKGSGAVVYDNQIGAVDDADPATAISGGSIVIHKAK